MLTPVSVSVWLSCGSLEPHLGKSEEALRVCMPRAPTVSPLHGRAETGTAPRELLGGSGLLHAMTASPPFLKGGEHVAVTVSLGPPTELGQMSRAEGHRETGPTEPS